MLIPLKQIVTPLISAPEFNLEFLGWLTILFFILAVVYFVGTFFIRNKIGAYNGRSRGKKMEFSPMISEFLFYEDSNSAEEKKNYLHLKVQIRELIKDNFDRKILTEVLLDLRKDLSGQSQTVLIELYRDLELHNVAYEKLTSRSWQIVSSGIVELTAMEVLESYGLLVKFINHRHGTIRKQAERAVVSLKEEGIGYFLDNTKYKISEWQQIKLLDVLRHKQDFKAPQFSLWLTSTNTHVVLFALRLIKYYRQSNSIQSIITLLKHKNRDIQNEAIDCIKEFYLVDAIPTLKMVYTKANNDSKIAILDTLGEIGSISEVEFLKTLQKKEKNFNVKSKVVSTLNKINPESILPTLEVNDVDYFTTELLKDIQIEKASIPVNESLSTNITDGSKSNGDEKVEISTLNDVFTENSEKGTPLPMDSLIDKTAETIIPSTCPIHHSIIGIESDAPIKNDKVLTVDTMADSMATVQDEQHQEVEPMFLVDSELLSAEDITSNRVKTVEIDFEEIDWSILLKIESTEVTKEPTQQSETLPTFKDHPVSFSAHFMDEEELETMVLLENIAELGDSRELPTLYQLKLTSTSPLILERATELIQKFSYQPPRPKELFSSDNDLSGSVFNAIFELSDVETKLILLEEIKRIGDEREIRLLESLVSDENSKIASSATLVLNHIRSEISKKEYSKRHSVEGALFELDLENAVQNNNIEITTSTLKDDGSTLFDQLCSMSTSLYHKING